MRYLLFVLLIPLGLVIGHQQVIKTRKNQDDMEDRIMHPKLNSNDRKSRNSKRVGWSWLETETDYWYTDARNSLEQKLKNKLNTNVAKNIIVFVGDGMSIPTLFATRTYQGQLEGKSGEEGALFWENFPYTGLSKTWCIDRQVPDSACTSTAYMCGVKTKYGTLGINGKAIRGVCATQNNPKNHVDSVLKWAQDQGKSVGIVTTTRVTHASPAGSYAHIAERTWESDANILENSVDPLKCMDIAQQLITKDPGQDFKVILGGGRREFLPENTIDDEGDAGKRKDGRNLIVEWKNDKASRGRTYLYSWNRTTLINAVKNPWAYDYLLGLYDSSHMSYHLEADSEKDPTLSEMTEAAVKILRANKNGFMLFVEGGRIDQAHHGNHATLALDETLEFAKAVKTGWELTSTNDTLIIATADHSHTMSVSGYSPRGSKITGPSHKIGSDNIKYATLSYANGPGYRAQGTNGDRHDIDEDNMDDLRYRFPTMVPLESETHAGDDVAIFSSGPWAHLFTGTIQQSNIPHFIAYASCLKPNYSACNVSSKEY